MLLDYFMLISVFPATLVSYKLLFWKSPYYQWTFVWGCVWHKTNFRVISSMNDSLLDDFEVTLDGSKSAVAELGAQLTDFGPLCFENCILVHIIVTNLLCRMRSLNNISNRDCSFFIVFLRGIESTGRIVSRNICGKVLRNQNLQQVYHMGCFYLKFLWTVSLIFPNTYLL